MDALIFSDLEVKYFQLKDISIVAGVSREAVRRFLFNKMHKVNCLFER